MKIAVGIPTNDRPESLIRAVESAVNQTILPAEIVIVNDGRAIEDDVLDRIRALTNTKGLTLKYIDKDKGRDKKGLTRSRNIIIENTDADIIQFIDDDAELSSTCIEAVFKLFSEDKDKMIAAVDFPIKEVLSGHLGRRFIELCYKLSGLWKPAERKIIRMLRSRTVPIGIKKKIPDVRKVFYLHGGSFAIRRDFLLDVGGFDESLGLSSMGEDKDISLKLLRRGLLLRITSMEVMHYSEPTGRISPFLLGYESVYNYLRIIRNNLDLDFGDFLLVLYNLCFLFLVESLFVLLGDSRYHILEVLGMAKGFLAFIVELCWQRK